VSQREDMLRSQGGLCLICGVLLTVVNLHTDHDHATGVVRGLLCINCNQGLGQFKDSPELLMRAATYLKGVISQNAESLHTSQWSAESADR